jgi:hypothetical protein
MDGIVSVFSGPPCSAEQSDLDEIEVDSESVAPTRTPPGTSSPAVSASSGRGSTASVPPESPASSPVQAAADESIAAPEPEPAASQNSESLQATSPGRRRRRNEPDLVETAELPGRQ